MSGFELVGHISGYSRSIIFTTAYDTNIHPGYPVSALDYLLKPIDPGRAGNRQLTGIYSKAGRKRYRLRELYNSFLENLKRQESQSSLKLALPVVLVSAW